MPQLPTPIRAALGLAAEAAEQARHLPDKAIELPMLAVSTALQLSLRAQQRYAELAAKGDDLLNHRPTSDEPPPWATFDAPVDEPPTFAGLRAADDPPSETAGQASAEAGAEAGAEVTGTSAGDSPDEPPALAKRAPGKSVKRPRTGTPSRFDAVGDE